MKSSIQLFAASLIIFGGLTEVQAFDKGQFQNVQTGQKECTGCDLSNANFYGLDLTRVNFAGAKLDGAVLSRSHLAGANLKGASFTGARIDQIDFTKVNLVGVNLAKAWCDFSTKLPAGSEWTCEGVIITRR